jgi:hypothetical protein
MWKCRSTFVPGLMDKRQERESNQGPSTTYTGRSSTLYRCTCITPNKIFMIYGSQMQILVTDLQHYVDSCGLTAYLGVASQKQKIFQFSQILIHICRRATIKATQEFDFNYSP